jgi:small-conductance mechanosensitive channel
MGMDRIKTLLIWSMGLLLLGAAALPESYAQESSAKQAPAAVSAGNAQKSSAEKSPPATQPATIIPPAEIAAKATEATNLLVTLSTKYISGSQIDKVQKPFYEISRQIEQEYDDVSMTLQENPSLATLQTLHEVWQTRRERIDAWLQLLTERALDLKRVLNRLAGLNATWTQTQKSAREEKAPEETLQQIETVLNAIQAAQVPLHATHDRLLGLQSLISEALKRCDDTLTHIVQAQKGVVTGILTRELPPIWGAGQWHSARIAIPVRFRQNVDAARKDLGDFLQDPSRELPLQVFLFMVLLALLIAAKRFAGRWDVVGDREAHLGQVFERPYAAALFTVWLFATRYASPTPPMVKELFTALALIPVFRLVQPAFPPRIMPKLYAVGVLFAVDTLRGFFAGVPVLAPSLLMVEGLAAIGVLVWLLTSGDLLDVSTEESASVRRKTALLLKAVMIYLAVGVAAGALGHLRLARLITPGTISAVVLALAFFAGVRLFGGVVTVLLRLWPFKWLRMVQAHGPFLEQWAYRLLVWLAVAGWGLRLLDQLGLLDPILTIGSGILAVKFERGAISISIGDILAFGITVAVAFVLSGLIRFMLNEEIYPRAHIPSGTAYASSRLLHYTVLTLGFLVGLALLGVNLTKISVLAGAFGVGIGFGLQSVVNNFVCGLILLFERPVHVGDTVELDGVLGEVRIIGFRASTVRTRQGADIIIPNAQFITAKVTNWTFRDRLRRIDLSVGVAYASEPNKVMALMEKVARDHPHILAYPAPKCFFTSYGDSAINFQLLAWTDQSSDLTKVPQIESDLNAAVYDAVKAAGMSFPFPQREVRLLGDTDLQAAAANKTAPPPPEMEKGAGEDKNRK